MTTHQPTMPLRAVLSSMMMVTLWGWAAAVAGAADHGPPLEQSFTLDGALGANAAANVAADAAAQGKDGTTFVQWLGDNLRVNVDVIGRVMTTSRRGEAEGFVAVGLDVHKVLSDSDGDFATMVLQPYAIRRDNV
jgi:hypothetical protein